MNYKGWLKRVLKLLLIITIFCSEFQTVNQVFASELTFYNHNTKSNVKYTGKQVFYSYNNKISIKVTKFSASHNNGGQMIYHNESS